MRIPTGEHAILTARCVGDLLELWPGSAGPQHAVACLQRLMDEHGRLELDKPAWVHGAKDWPGVPRWIVMGDVALLVQYAADHPDRLLAPALLMRGSVGLEVRTARTGRRANKRAYRHARRHQDGKGSHGGPARRERRDRKARDSLRDEE